MDYSELRNEFPDLIIKENEALSNYTYTETGGPADILFFPSSIKEVQAVVNWTLAHDLEMTILGNASNLIVRDGGIRGVTIILTELKDMAIKDEQITVEAGAAIIDLSESAYDQGLTGLEFACGIPGSVGGAVYMNAGAYGGEVKDVIETVTLLSREGEIKVLSNEEMNFSYRKSILQESQDIVLSITVQLSKGNKERIREKMDELTFLRTSKQPLEYPSCGSVFKRPVGHYTGKLIQDAGLQGLIWGGAQVSTKHAGFIVNIANATASDYIELIKHIQAVIFKETGVKLEREVHIIGESISERVG